MFGLKGLFYSITVHVVSPQLVPRAVRDVLRFFFVRAVVKSTLVYVWKTSLTHL